MSAGRRGRAQAGGYNGRLTCEPIGEVWSKRWLCLPIQIKTKLHGKPYNSHYSFRFGQRVLCAGRREAKSYNYALKQFLKLRIIQFELYSLKHSFFSFSNNRWHCAAERRPCAGQVNITLA
jgi:hypothetical protein